MGSLSEPSVHGILQARILEWVPCPPAGDLPDSGIESMSFASPALQTYSLLLSHQGSHYKIKGGHNFYRYLEKDDITSVKVGRSPCEGTKESISEELSM